MAGTVIAAGLPAVAFARLAPDPRETVEASDAVAPRVPTPKARATSTSVYLPPPTAKRTAVVARPADVAPPAVPTDVYTLTSHIHVNGDGTDTGQFFTGPAFHQLADGSWAPIDPTLSVLDGLGSVVGGVLPTQLGISTGSLVSLTLPSGQQITESLDGPDRTLIPTFSGTSVTYPDLATDTTATLTSEPDGIRELLLLKDANAPTSFTFHLADPTHALGSVSEGADGSWTFSASVGSGAYLTIPPAEAYEPVPVGVIPATAPGSAHETVTQTAAGWDVTSSLDPSWLANATYPIVLDPTLTYGGGGNSASSTGNAVFVQQSPGNPDCNGSTGGCMGGVPGAGSVIGAGTYFYDDAEDAHPARTLFDVNTSGILAGSTVTSASLRLEIDHCLGDPAAEDYCAQSGATYTEEVGRMDAAWTPSDTWGDLSFGALGSGQSLVIPGYQPSADDNQSETIPITATAQSWVDSGNYGMYLRLTSEPATGSIGGPAFDPDADGTVAYRPLVTITYSPPPNKMAAPGLSRTGETQLTATVAAPANAGPQISSYTVRLYNSGGTLVQTHSCSTSTGAACAIAPFTGLAYGSYYATAYATNSIGSSAISAASSTVTLAASPVITKTILTAATNGYYSNGQQVSYQLAITNPSSTAISATVSDALPGTLVANGTSLLLNGADCSATGTGVCSIVNGVLTTSAITIAGGSTSTLVYNVVLAVASQGCATVTNAATATNSNGSTTSSVPINVCDAGLGIEPWWSYDTTNLGADQTAQVNVANGNLVVQAQDSTVTPARGRLAYVIRRTYNSQEQTALTLPGTLGGGWQLNLGQADDLADAGITTEGLIVPQVATLASTLTNPLSITLVDRDGTRHVFTYNNTTVNGQAPITPASPINLTTLASTNPVRVALAPLGSLLAILQGTTYGSVCVDSTYTAPAGVHLSMWRFIGIKGSGGCSDTANGQVIGYEAVRPDRLRYEYDATGHLLDMIDGSGTDMRYGYSNIAYNYPGVPVTPVQELTSIYEARSCAGSVGSATCRGITISYTTDGKKVAVVDVAGRETDYIRDGVGPVNHLLEVVNPPEVANSNNLDHITYTYDGVSGVTCTGATVGQLCSVADVSTATTRTTSFTYVAAALGSPKVATVTTRNGNTKVFTYYSGPQYTTVDLAGRRTRYTSIDAIGRVGEIDQGTTADVYSHQTTYTWETQGATCTFVNNGVEQTKNDNELCSTVQSSLGSGPNRGSLYFYDPQGQPLLTGTSINSSGGRYTTYGYTTQYVKADGSTTAVTDTPVGKPGVTVGDHADQLSSPTLLYAITDLTSEISPNGNAASPPGGYADYETTFAPANATGVAPGAVLAASTPCTSRNSGVLCSSTAPYQLSPFATATTSATYDDFGQKVTSTDADGNTTTYTYSGVGLDLSRHTDTEGWLSQVTDAQGHYVLFQYDAAGNVVRTFDRDATSAVGFTAATSTQYAQTLYASSLTAMPWRFPLSSRDPLGNTTTYTVDQDGDQLTITDPLGNVTTQTFDADDNETSVITPLESASTATVTAYDAFDEPTSVRDPDGDYTVTRYDAVGRVSEVDTDRGPSASTYQPPACAVSASGNYAPIPNGEVVCSTTAAYDGLDDKVSTSDANAQTSTYTYDGSGDQLTAVVPGAGSLTTLTTTNVYDTDGNKILTCSPRQVTEGGGGCTSTSTFATNTTFDQQDRAVSTSYLRAAPATHGAVLTVPATQTITTSTVYDPAGNKISTTDADGVKTTNVYDSLNRLISSSVPRTASQSLTTSYGYDPSGNRTYTDTPDSGATGTGSLGDLTVDGGTYPASKPYLLTGSSQQYRNVTLTNGGTIVTSPADLLQVEGTLSVCATCAITADGLGFPGGARGTAISGTGAATAGGGAGGGGAGGWGALYGGGGGGGGHRTVGSAGSTSTLAGSAGTAGGTTAFTGAVAPTSADFGSGGGGGGEGGIRYAGSGGNGGGAIHIVADTVTVAGRISANGSYGGNDSSYNEGGGGGGGAGGTVWITAQSLSIPTGGVVSAYGGPGGSYGNTKPGGAGGQGYVELDAGAMTGSTPVGATVTGNSGVITAYSYDADNRNVDTVVGASSSTASQAGVAGPNGDTNVRTRIGYDADGRKVAVWSPDAFRTSVTSPDSGYEQVSVYDNDSRLVASYQPRFDTADPEPIAGADASQCQTGSATGIAAYANVPGLVVCKATYGYDAAGRKITATLPTSTGSDNRKYTYAYTPDGLTASVMEPNPSQNTGASLITADTYTYDGPGRQLTDTNALGYVTTTTYAPNGWVTQTALPPSGSLTHVTTNTYDAAGDQLTSAVTVGSGAQTTTTSYNSDGTVFTSSDGTGDVTSYGYDAAGNKTSVWSPSANSHASGATGTPDANFGSGLTGTPATAATRYTFTPDDLVASELEPVASDGSVFRQTLYGYDGSGRKVTDDVLTVNATGTQIADGGTESWSYFPDSRISLMSGRGGETTAYAYEPGGGQTSAVLTRTGGGSTSTTTQTFYLDGSARTSTTDGSTTSYAYDAVGSESAVSQTDAGTTKTQTLSYSDAELPTSINATAYGVGTVTNTYDTLGRPTSTSWSTGSETVSRTWQPDDTLTNQTLTGSSGTLASWDYAFNGAFQQTETRYTAGSNTAALPACPTGTTLASAGVSCYGYDASGRLASYADDVATRTITDDHDSNRLTYGDSSRPTVAPVTTQTYNADNSVATVASGTTTTSDCYTAFGGLGYDETGTATCAQITASGAGTPAAHCNAYTYDGYDTELSVADGGGGTCGSAYSSTFTRDALGRIATRTDTGAVPTTGTTTMSYDGPSDQIVAESGASGLVSYASSTAGLLAVQSTSASQPLVTDPDGNVVATASTTGGLACSLRYDPYGNASHVASGQTSGQQCSNTGGGTPSDLRYQAAQQDPGSGSYHFGARTYDPTKDAFTTPDDADASTGGNPQSIGADPLTENTYDYVNGDPLNLSDPTGHRVICNNPLGINSEACHLAPISHGAGRAYVIAPVHNSASCHHTQSCITGSIVVVPDGSTVDTSEIDTPTTICSEGKTESFTKSGAFIQLSTTYCVTVDPGQASDVTITTTGSGTSEEVQADVIGPGGTTASFSAKGLDGELTSSLTAPGPSIERQIGPHNSLEFNENFNIGKDGSLGVEADIKDSQDSDGTSVVLSATFEESINGASVPSGDNDTSYALGGATVFSAEPAASAATAGGSLFLQFLANTLGGSGEEVALEGALG